MARVLRWSCIALLVTLSISTLPSTDAVTSPSVHVFPTTSSIHSIHTTYAATLILTTQGEVFSLVPDGATPWTRVVFPSEAGSRWIEDLVVSDDTRSVLALGPSPHRVHFLSTDGGSTWVPIETPGAVDVGGLVPAPAPPQLALFHPHHANWALVFLASEGCAAFSPQCFRSLAMTRDGGDSWTVLADYVVDAGWADTLPSSEYADDAVFVVRWRDGLASGKQSDAEISADMVWEVLDPKPDPRLPPAQELMLPGFAFSIDVALQVLYVSSASETDAVGLVFTMMASHDGKTFRDVTFSDPPLLDESSSIVFVEEDAAAVLLYVEEGRKEWGSLFVSSADGVYFEKVLTHVVPGSFAPVAGMPALFLANVVTHPYGQDGGVTSMISFDNGGEWGRVGELEGTRGAVPVLDLDTLSSTRDRPGLLFCSGEVPGKGPGMLRSVDGARTWTQIGAGRDSTGVYVFSRHGLHLQVPVNVDVTSLVAASGIGLGVVIPLSESGSEAFVVESVGNVVEVRVDSVGGFSWLIKAESEMDGYVLIEIHFAESGLPPVCSEASYEVWHPPGLCVLGRNSTFTRSLEACIPRATREELGAPCVCVADDWECDVGYTLSDDELCVVASSADGEGVFLENNDCPESGVLMRGKGYRRVAGDVCVAGPEDPRAPERIPCVYYGDVERGEGGGGSMLLIEVVVFVAAVVLVGGTVVVINLARGRHMFGFDPESHGYLPADVVGDCSTESDRTDHTDHTDHTESDRANHTESDRVASDRVASDRTPSEDDDW